jgi:regulator of ribosome biosynthesis
VTKFPGVARREELREECLRKGTELAQAVADALFALPATEDRDGPMVRLPPPTTRFPREKHVRPEPIVCILLSNLCDLPSIICCC